MPNLTCHQLRHTFANVLCEKGVQPKIAQRLLGHADIQTTMDIYTSVDNDVLYELYKEQINGENKFTRKNKDEDDDTDYKYWEGNFLL